MGKKNRLINTTYDFDFIPVICYEIIFFNDLLSKINQKSPILINITNDAWFGKHSGPYQHFYLSRIRSTEFNKFLIRVSNNGVSATIDNYGRIINITSTSVKQPIDGLGISNTIRGAVANWAKTLSFELGEYGITVNNILPGYTDTQRLQEIFLNKSKKNNYDIETIISDAHSQIPLGRFADPKETAKAICFLASEDASYINGINLPVDGGRLSTL